MNLLSKLLLALVLLSFRPAIAQEVSVGTGLLCDTQQEAEKFVAAYKDSVEAALAIVNTEAKNDSACALAQVAYIRGEAKAVVQNSRGIFEITEITVIGALIGGNVVQVEPTVQYTLFPAKGVAI